MLGDHLYQSHSSINCVAQLIEAYEKTEKLTLGLFEISAEDAPKYGVVKGMLADSDDVKLVKLDAIIEKPSIKNAQSHLGIDGNQYAVFMYVLTTEVYKALAQQFRDGKTEFGEFQLTPALDWVMNKQGAYGFLIDGKRYDVGLPEEYRSTVAKFGR
jgi:UTP-glucose-1-phosphate uridylyltransferase